MSKAVFIDRDGTLNEEVNYLSDPHERKFIKGAIDALRLLQNSGYRIILVTNQSGIASGKITLRQLEEIHKEMSTHLVINGIAIADEEIFFCPHSSSENCDCRKPQIRNFIEAEKRYKLDPKKCWAIGDKTSDIEAGKRGGYKTILVRTGYAGKDGKYDVHPDFVASDLLSAAEMIIKTDRPTPK